MYYLIINIIFLKSVQLRSKVSKENNNEIKKNINEIKENNNEIKVWIKYFNMKSNPTIVITRF